MDDSEILGRIVGTTGALATCHLSRTALAASRSTLAHDMANTSVGAIMRIMVAGTPVFASLVDLALDKDDAHDDAIVASAEYLGEGTLAESGALANFRRGLTAYPQPGDEIRFATEAELSRIFAPPDVPHVQIGRVYPTRNVRAPILFDQLLARHFAIVGQAAQASRPP